MSPAIDRTRGRARQSFLRPLAVLMLIAAGCAAGGSPGGSASGTWGGARLIQPAELAATLADSAAAKPLLLHVGVRVLYRGGAIPGSRYVGPGSTAAGIDSMLAAVRTEPRDRAIVIYCGCCPAEHCPNMKPAFAAMHKAGFTNVNALMIVKDFEHDWADHGYPTEKPAL